MLQEFWEDVGIPENLKSYRESELCGKESSYINLSKGKWININYKDPECSN